MTFFAWPVVGLVWLLDRLWERRRARRLPSLPRPVVHHARPLTDTEVQHRQALALVIGEPVATVPDADALEPDDEAIVARLLDWLADGGRSYPRARC